MEVYKEVDKLINFANELELEIKQFHLNKRQLSNIIEEYIREQNIEHISFRKAIVILVEISVKYNYSRLYEKYRDISDNAIEFSGPFDKIFISDKSINLYENENLIGFLNKHDDFINNYDDYEYISEAIEYIIHFKKFDLLLHIFKSKYWNDIKYYEELHSLLLIFSNYLWLLSDNILFKILDKVSYNFYKYDDSLFIDLQLMYYLYYKIYNTKYIPFELFPLNYDKQMIYTSMLLLNDEYVETKNIALIKFNNIFNRLHYDLQLP